MLNKTQQPHPSQTLGFFIEIKMTTQNLVLTKTPQQITDGSTSTLFMQSLNRREFCFVVSDSTPNPSIKPHTSQEINLNGEVKLWAWSNVEIDIPVVVTKF